MASWGLLELLHLRKGTGMARTPKPRAEKPRPAAAPMVPVELGVSELVANPRNPRLHPEAQLAQLAASLRRFGQPRPLIARASNKMLIAGHGIWEAARRAGLVTVKVLLWDVDQKTADLYMLADNKLPEGAADQPDKIAALLRELREDEDMQALGFDAAEIGSLLAEPDELQVAEIETGPVTDTFWISVRGPLLAQAAMLAGLRKLAEAHPQIEVELGTVAEQ